MYVSSLNHSLNIFFQKKFTGPCLSLWIPKSGTFKICEILLVFSAVLFGLAYANIFQAPT